MEAELTELNKFVKETDPSRMTSRGQQPGGPQEAEQYSGPIAFNTYPGWYGAALKP